MRQSGRARAAVVVILAIACATVSPAPRAAAAAALAGRVFGADGHTARSGATVSLVTEQGQRSAQSTPTTSEGSFSVSGVMPGEYRLLIEATEGAYMTTTPVNLAAGMNPPLALSLAPGQAFQTTASSTTAGASTWPQWAKWAVAGGIGVAALIVINEVNDEDDPASGF